MRMLSGAPSRLNPPRFLTAMVVALAFYTSSGFGCEFPWSVPVTYFDSVDENGIISYSQQIGELDLSDGIKVPLVINFRSDRESFSPYLGKGWVFALFDSQFVQLNENSFQLIQPDGRMQQFTRPRVTDTELRGDSDWRAEILGDKIVASTTCGWKFVYLKGRLASIGAPKNRSWELVYSAGKVAEMRENGATKMTANFDQAGSKVCTLSYNGRQVEIIQKDRPRVQAIGGQNVVAGLDGSLSQITGAVSGPNRFEFAVDEKIRPTLKLTAPGKPERLIVWNPATKRVANVDQWTYSVTDANDRRVDIARTSKDVTESRSFDLLAGTERTASTDGPSVQSQWFSSGKTAGRIRKIVVAQKGEDVTKGAIGNFIYDENGVPIRVVVIKGAEKYIIQLRQSHGGKE